jgi:hypothetical protein
MFCDGEPEQEAEAESWKMAAPSYLGVGFDTSTSPLSDDMRPTKNK